MIRTQVSLTEEQMRRAKRVASGRNVSLAELVRQALDAMLAGDDDRRRRERARTVVGTFRSGTADTSTRHDEVLAERDRW